MDTTELVRQAAPVSYPSSAKGHILKAAASFTEGVRVVLPAGSTERTYGPCAWGAIHGSSLPATGAACVVVFDEQNQPTIVWWEGPQGGGEAVESLTLAKLLTLGTGEILGARTATPPAAHHMDERDGTLASPVKIGVSASYSRFDATTRKEVNEQIGPAGTDGPDGATVARFSIKGTAASEVQVVAVVADAWQTGEYHGVEGSADACPLYSFARVTNNGTGRAIPAYFESSRETLTSNGQQALELRVKNQTGEANTYSPGSFSTSMGIELNASGNANSACGFEVGAAFGHSFDTGIAFHPGSITGATFRDDSESERGIFITSPHAKGSIIVKPKAGVVTLNREEPTAGTHLLELFAAEGETFDPIMKIGGVAAGVNVAAEWHNAVGQMKGFIAAGAKAFLPETAAGDCGFGFTPGKTFHIGAVTVEKSVLKLQEKAIGYFGHAPAAQEKVAAVASNEATLITLANSLRTMVIGNGMMKE